MNEHQDTCIYTATSSVWQKVFDVKYMSFYILNKRLSYMGGCLLFFLVSNIFLVSSRNYNIYNIRSIFFNYLIAEV